MSPLDSAVEELRMNGGTLEALADVLPLTPANKEWLRRQRLEESANDRHARALVSSRLMKKRDFPWQFRLATVATLHYAGRQHGAARNIVDGNVSAEIRARANALEAWIREDGGRLAKYLAELPEIFSG